MISAVLQSSISYFVVFSVPLLNSPQESRREHTSYLQATRSHYKRSLHLLPQIFSPSDFTWEIFAAGTRNISPLPIPSLPLLLSLFPGHVPRPRLGLLKFSHDSDLPTVPPLAVSSEIFRRATLRCAALQLYVHGPSVYLTAVLLAIDLTFLQPYLCSIRLCEYPDCIPVQIWLMNMPSQSIRGRNGNVTALLQRLPYQSSYGEGKQTRVYDGESAEVP